MCFPKVCTSCTTAPCDWYRLKKGEQTNNGQKTEKNSENEQKWGKMSKNEQKWGKVDENVNIKKMN